MPHVLACGMATVDIRQVVDAVPGPNDKVPARDTRVEAGGPALNAAITAAVLGSEVALVTAVGHGLLGDIVRRDCAAYGVELIDCAPQGFETPLATVLVTGPTGERAVVSRHARGIEEYAVPLAEDISRLLEGVGAVLVDGHHLPVAEEVAAAARVHGIPVLLDGGSWKPGLDRLLSQVDVAVVSADFVAPHRDSLEELAVLGPSWVARSAGARPVRWRGPAGSSGEVPVQHVPDDEVVDTLGAGDVLHGALLHALGRDGLRDVPAALAEAAEVASRSVTAPGARGWADQG